MLYMILNGFKTHVAILSLWVWVKVEGFWILLYVHTRVLKLLTSLFDSIIVLAHESHIFLDWKNQPSSTYTPRFAHTALQFLGSKGECNFI